MFRINPSDAQTSLYGINKADAQVFDNRQLQDRLYKKQDQQIADKKVKEVEEKGLLTGIGKLGKGTIRPSDLGYFADRQKSIYDKVKQYYKEAKGGNLSVDQQVEIENDIAHLNSEAGVSSQLSAENTANAKVYSANPDKFDEESINAIKDNQFNAVNAGKWGATTGLREHYDYGAHVLKDLVPKVNSMTEHNSQRGYKSYTKDQAYRLIANDLEDEVKYAQVARDFNRDKDKRGATTPVEYAQAKYWEDLFVDEKPPLTAAQMGLGGGNTDKSSVRVTHTTKDDSEEYSVQDPKTNEEIVVIKKDGKIVGGIKGGRLTPTEKSERDKALADNSRAKQTFEREVNALKKRAVEEGLTPEEVAAEMPKKPSWYPLTVPHQEKGVEVDAVEAQKIAFNKYSVNVEDLANGKQSNIVVQPVDARTKNKVKPKLDY